MRSEVEFEPGSWACDCEHCRPLRADVAKLALENMEMRQLMREIRLILRESSMTTSTTGAIERTVPK